MRGAEEAQLAFESDSAADALDGALLPQALMVAFVTLCQSRKLLRWA